MYGAKNQLLFANIISIVSMFVDEDESFDPNPCIFVFVSLNHAEKNGYHGME